MEARKRYTGVRDAAAVVDVAAAAVVVVVAVAAAAAVVVVHLKERGGRENPKYACGVCVCTCVCGCDLVSGRERS